jgi:hypothetical protein
MPVFPVGTGVGVQILTRPTALKSTLAAYLLVLKVMPFGPIVPRLKIKVPLLTPSLGVSILTTELKLFPDIVLTAHEPAVVHVQLAPTFKP